MVCFELTVKGRPSVRVRQKIGTVKLGRLKMPHHELAVVVATVNVQTEVCVYGFKLRTLYLDYIFFDEKGGAFR